ncbi:MAG: GNAT family N-acetyltransferase [Deltaproteobacteria bacterium]|nr:GNAT family N-acetyltransferase [Deltaproteobacteria bacterium]MDQ3295999.1 acetyltransferase [Myxococcota bacterium]
MRGYDFRPVVEADLSLIARWRGTPHVSEWWGAPSGDDEREKLDEPRIAMWIVELDGRPFAFAQDYDVHGWSPHPFSHLPPWSRGIDQYIGEADMLDQGHGSAFVRQHVERLFAAGAPAVGTDPHPSNMRARRAYEKAGFAVTSEPVDTPWGRAVLMECWSARTAP